MRLSLWYVRIGLIVTDTYQTSAAIKLQGTGEPANVQSLKQYDLSWQINFFHTLSDGLTCGPPPIADQRLPTLYLGRQIAKWPFLWRDNRLDLAYRCRAFFRVFLTAEAMDFKTAIVGHHVLKA
jgi:hypothetical protein